nr:aminotransferase class V-fold PLP-dependent enzyme [Bacteroidota bacterium]
FPTDLYILEGIVHHLGPDYELSLAKTSDGQTTDMQSLEELIDKNTALVVLSHVAFKSAFMYDMEKVTQLAHRHGALILWDLSHSAGAVPVELNKAGADLAVGCTYKYLNGGPGSPAFLYVANNLVDKLESPFWGWFGAGDPFAFGLNYKPAGGIRKFLVGTPPVLSLAPVSKGLDIMLSAGMDKIRKKSILQTEYLIFLTHKHLTALGFTFGTPLDYNVRGSHISLQHDEAYRICHALIQPENGSYKVIPDFREPNNIRFGIAPLYTSFEEFFLAVEKMRRVVEDNIFLKFDTIKNGVT